MKKVLGYQILVDFENCDTKAINNAEKVKEVLLKSAEIANFTVVETLIHQFNPQGVSGVVVIEESHIAIHTWPEHQYASIDFFSCRNEPKVQEAIVFLQKAFKAQKIKQELIKRGELNL